MKKLYIILTLVIVSFLMVFAGDTIKILRIYYNGTFTAIPLTNIDSIDHSKYDTNGKLLTNHTSSIIETLDSTYNIPINLIDSVSIVEADLDDYNKIIKSLQDYISKQEEQDLTLFQTNLTNWLNSQEWVKNVSLHDESDYLIITFINGIDFFIFFQDISFFDNETNNNRLEIKNIFRQPSKSEFQFFDVPHIDDEIIITKRKNLYIKGTEMPFSRNHFEEYEEIISELGNSPININFNIGDTDNKDFLSSNFSDYDMVFITQTHGIKDNKGAFILAAKETDKNMLRLQNGIVVYKHKRTFIQRLKQWPKWYYVVTPEALFKHKDIDQNLIVFGNYCWSYYLTRTYIITNYGNCTIFGYKESSDYQDNKLTLLRFAAEMFNGYICEDALLHAINLTNEKYLPAANYINSKQRYFSISAKGTVNNEIKGIIYGYKNLRSGLKWMLYAHEGTEKFTPEDNNVKRIKDAYKPLSDGSFTVSSKIVNKYPDHSFIVGFEFAGKVYYGESMYFGGLHITIENIISDNHEFVIKGIIKNINEQDKSSYHCNIIEREGQDTISIDNFDDRGNARYKYIPIGEDGSVEYRISMDYYKRNTTYGFAIAVEYNGNWFFSDTKYCSWDWCPDDKHPHMIDLDLTSGTKWACCNIGSNKPEDYGNYFAWGETIARTSDFTKWEYEHFDKENVKIIDIGDNIAGTKYDAASTIWGSTWRMPTKEQFEELVKECKYDLLTVNNMNGLRLKGKNGNIIFLPYSGSLAGEGNGVSHLDLIGHYWSSTAGSLESAYNLYFYNILVELKKEPKIHGLTIRPVGH